MLQIRKRSHPDQSFHLTCQDQRIATHGRLSRMLNAVICASYQCSAPASNCALPCQHHVRKYIHQDLQACHLSWQASPDKVMSWSLMHVWRMSNCSSHLWQAQAHNDQGYNLVAVLGCLTLRMVLAFAIREKAHLSFTMNDPTATKSLR